jgi:hypothetical protein
MGNQSYNAEAQHHSLNNGLKPIDIPVPSYEGAPNVHLMNCDTLLWLYPSPGKFLRDDLLADMGAC